MHCAVSNAALAASSSRGIYREGADASPLALAQPLSCPTTRLFRSSLPELMSRVIPPQFSEREVPWDPKVGDVLPDGRVIVEVAEGQKESERPTVWKDIDVLMSNVDDVAKAFARTRDSVLSALLAAALAPLDPTSQANVFDAHETSRS
jgi:hypothetical protein